MLRKGFINGLLTGGLLGVAAMVFVAPQFKKERNHLMDDSKQASHRARRVIKGIKNATDDWMK